MKVIWDFLCIPVDRCRELSHKNVYKIGSHIKIKIDQLKKTNTNQVY